MLARRGTSHLARRFGGLVPSMIRQSWPVFASWNHVHREFPWKLAARAYNTPLALALEGGVLANRNRKLIAEAVPRVPVVHAVVLELEASWARYRSCNRAGAVGGARCFHLRGGRLSAVRRACLARASVSAPNPLLQ